MFFFLIYPCSNIKFECMINSYNPFSVSNLVIKCAGGICLVSVMNKFPINYKLLDFNNSQEFL